MESDKNINIFGIPYFPGIAVGQLVHGINAITIGSIAMITQNEIISFTSLPSGFIIVGGAPFSHTTISLRGYGIPIIFVSEQKAAGLKAGVQLLIDGEKGLITDEIDKYKAVQNIPSVEMGQVIFTADDVPIKLYASVRQAEAAKIAVQKGAYEIGLVRSEFLFPKNDRIPDVDFYRKAFRDICESAMHLPVTIRLLDLAADKIPAWLTKSDNIGGVLGLQGVRMYETEPIAEVINAQIEAIDILSDEFNLRILIPYLIRLEELVYWHTFIRRKIHKTLPIGAMAETPASALDINNWLSSADFIAIGCNDLMQCLYAVDRDRAELSQYLDPYAPFLYRFFRQVVEQSGTNIDKVYLCGVLPQLQGVLQILIGLGFRGFSVDALMIPYLTKTVSSINTTDAKSIAADVCSAKETREVLETLRI